MAEKTIDELVTDFIGWGNERIKAMEAQNLIRDLRERDKYLKEEIGKLETRIAELEAKVKEKEDTIYILNMDSLDKTEKIRTLNQNLSNLKGQISHNYDLGYEEGKKDAFNTPGQVFKCEISNRGSEAYLDGFKAGIEWLNGVLKK